MGLGFWDSGGESTVVIPELGSGELAKDAGPQVCPRSGSVGPRNLHFVEEHWLSPRTLDSSHRSQGEEGDRVTAWR